jgi:TRAP-type C4-dicarboxylate transport system permease small subunit
MNAILKVRDIIEKGILAVAAVLVGVMALLIALQVLVRSIGIGVDWTEEFARFSYVGVTFMGSILAITKGKHITIDFVANLMPDFIRRVLIIGIHLVIAAFMLICVYGSTVIMAASRGVPSNSMSWFKLNYVYGIVLACCAMMAIVSVIRALEFAIMKKELPRGVEE